MATLEEHKAAFFRAVLPAHPNEWDVDEVFSHLAGLDSDSRELLLSHVPAIWPVSHSLCFAYLTDGCQALAALPPDLLPEWVRQVLAAYERRGLIGAREFMAEVDRHFLAPLRGEAGLSFPAIAPLLLCYIRGVSGQPLELAEGSLPATDTQTIYLPEYLDIFPEKAANALLYKLLVSLQWLHIRSGIYRNTGADETLAVLADYRQDGQLARDLFAVLRFRDAFAAMVQTLPGLARAAREPVLRMVAMISAGGGEKGRCQALQGVLRAALEPQGSLERQNMPDNDRLAMLYAEVAACGGTYSLGPCRMLLGEFDFVRAEKVVRERREEQKTRFVKMMAAFLEQQASASLADRPPGEVAVAAQPDALLLLGKNQARNREQSPRRIENEGAEMSQELAALIAELEKDLGFLPPSYIQAAVGMAGGGGLMGDTGTETELSPPVGPAPGGAGLPYDEWDYRRGGYRHGWCTLYEKPLLPVGSFFVENTLRTYRPQLKKLRRQFEMLRTRRRFVRRRRFGDEIDLDALIEALGDRAAGRTPSDRLFFRLLRDERDISALFLIDMSNSTEGWVGTAMKEALVLLAESLEVVGDRYGMYGFSGMRRSRSDLFEIKHPDEPYTRLVQQRIAAIAPREYTRMGPPLRHLTRRLREMPSRLRLLIVISDGKPEDYDDYKGDYAIEDTRKALLEAKGSGVYPFCITIDKMAQGYLAHMFGRGNYIFIDNVRSLPAKMPEMYRLLTS